MACRRLDVAVFLSEIQLCSLITVGEMASTWMITLFLKDVLTRVPERDYVFIPILNAGHWVLWLKMRQTPTGLDAKVRSPIIFCDPLNIHPTTRVRTLGDLAIRHISSRTHDHCIINNGQFHELRIPTQPNGTDCGYYVMQTIRMLVEELIQGFESDQFVSIYEI